MYSKFNPPQISSKLKELRRKRGLTQKQVAKSLNVRPVTVCNYERGKIHLTLEKAIELANMYGCSLDQIIGFEEKGDKDLFPASDSPKRVFTKIIPLINFGLFDNASSDIQHSIINDPVILVELGLNEIKKRRSPFETVTSTLTEKQRRAFMVELLKYLNSVIGIDHISRTEELSFMDLVLKSLSLDLSESEDKSIRRAFHKPYFGSSIDSTFPNRAIRRLLIWLMVTMANVDREYRTDERTYILAVAVGMGLNDSDFKYIESKVLISFNKTNKET